MGPSTADQITRLIGESSTQCPGASDALFKAVYGELRKLAAARLRHLGPAQTFQATELVHEAYLRLLHRRGSGDGAAREAVYEGRRHYFFAAARAIHDIVVERIRARNSLKRGGDRRRRGDSRLTLMGEAGDGTRILEISDALERLRAIDPDRADFVLLRYFGGLSCEQVADMLGISVATANRRWRFARAWLATELGPNDCGPAPSARDGAEALRAPRIRPVDEPTTPDPRRAR